jgi:hypothetical protein
MKRFACRILPFLAVTVLVSCGEASQSSHLSGNNHLNKSSSNQNSSQAMTPTDNARFPIAPNPKLTPGKLCDHESTYRYPEHIKYCERDVSSDLKKEIFVQYDQNLGFETTKMDRNSFKIDHLIPLCMGGSNDEDNLWPQHQSIYEHTDPIEPFLCGKLADGKLKQAEAVQLILTIKQSPYTAEVELQKLEAKY